MKTLHPFARQLALADGRHEDPFPRPKLSGRCRARERSSAADDFRSFRLLGQVLRLYVDLQNWKTRTPILELQLSLAAAALERG
jgi:hypothetical protein